MRPILINPITLNSKPNWSRQIRLAKVCNPNNDIKHWLMNCVNCDDSIERKHSRYLEQFQVLLEVICDGCLDLSYRRLCLDLINFPLFGLRELEEDADLSWDLRKHIILTNRAVFYEFKETFKFFESSLGE